MLANAPWVVAAIVVALLLGALLNPAKTPQPALGWYQHSGLQTLEWNNYLSWLRFNGQGKLAGQLEQQLAAGDVHAFSAAMLSPAFVTDSEQRARDFWSPAQRDTWSALRGRRALRVEWSDPLDWEAFAGRARSTSYVHYGEGDRAELEADLRSSFEAHAAADGTAAFDYEAGGYAWPAEPA